MPPGFQSSDFLLLLPEVIVVIGALVVLAADVLLSRADRVLSYLTLATLAAAALALAPAAGLNVTIARGLLAIDGFALFFKVLFLLAAALTVMMSALRRRHSAARAGNRSPRPSAER